jgi:hypothetical protein
MHFVAERVLPAYVLALGQALDDAIDRLPGGSLRTALSRLRRRLGQRRTPLRLNALHRLATIGEIEGWIEPEEAIVIRKLAYRVEFYARRSQVSRSDRNWWDRGTVRPRDFDTGRPWSQGAGTTPEGHDRDAV